MYIKGVAYFGIDFALYMYENFMFYLNMTICWTYELSSTSFLEMIMNYEFDDTDYEDMDDLALPEHIEYKHIEPEELILDAMNDVYG